jgi:hypothetical protein
MPRILAIDYGMKRTGIAVTDELQIIASGLTTIPSETAIDFLNDYFSKENVAKVLIGEPKQMNGQPSESTPIIEKFVKAFEGQEITEARGGPKAPSIANAAEAQIEQQYGAEAASVGMLSLFDILDKSIKGLA